RPRSFSTSGHISFSDRISSFRLVVNYRFLTKYRGKFLFFVHFFGWLSRRFCAIFSDELSIDLIYKLQEKVLSMANQLKYDRILDDLQELLKNQKLQAITVSEIVHTARIGKGSIYYYFPSKDAILDALVERNYEKPLQTAKDLANQ